MLVKNPVSAPGPPPFKNPGSAPAMPYAGARERFFSWGGAKVLICLVIAKF